MSIPLSYRQLNILVFLAPIGLLGFGYYLQYVDGLEPCPLCMTQRFCYMLIALFTFIAIFNQRNVIAQKVLGLLTTAVALTGLGVATRQVWLQSLPEDQRPACGITDLGYMFDVFPFFEAVQILFKGTGDCAEVQWTFLGLSIPGWSMIVFSGLAIAALIQSFRKLPSGAA